MNAKKAIAAVITASMILGTAPAALAATLNETTPAGNVLVKTSTTRDGGGTAENFTLTIPAETVIPWLSSTGADMGYKVSAQLETAHKINVTVTGSASSQLKTADGANTLPYSITGTQNYTSAGAVVTDVSVPLTLTVTDWTDVPIDEYTDTLTYTASIL